MDGGWVVDGGYDGDGFNTDVLVKAKMRWMVGLLLMVDMMVMLLQA